MIFVKKKTIFFVRTNQSRLFIHSLHPRGINIVVDYSPSRVSKTIQLGVHRTCILFINVLIKYRFYPFIVFEVNNRSGLTSLFIYFTRLSQWIYNVISHWRIPCRFKNVHARHIFSSSDVFMRQNNHMNNNSLVCWVRWPRIEEHVIATTEWE